MALLAGQIDELGLGDFYTVKGTEIVGANGTRFIFAGIRHNVTKIKSMEGVDVCWVEEAEKVSKESWDVLIPTIRKESSEIWISFNPKSKHDNTWVRFIETPSPDAEVVEVNWRDNPWFPEVLRKEMEHLKSISQADYLHIWEGLPLEDAGDTVFKPQWDQFWAARNYKGMNIYITVDPANSKKEGSDYTIFTVWGIGPDRNFYVIEWIRDKLDVYERALELFRLVQKYKPRKCGYEHYGMQADITVIEKLQEDNNYRFPIVALGGKVKKEDRIKSGLLPLLQEGRLFVPDHCTYTDRKGKTWDLTKEYMREKDVFPFADGFEVHDDMLDCMARIAEPDLGVLFPSGEILDVLAPTHYREQEDYNPFKY